MLEAWRGVQKQRMRTTLLLGWVNRLCMLKINNNYYALNSVKKHMGVGVAYL